MLSFVIMNYLFVTDEEAYLQLIVAEKKVCFPLILFIFINVLLIFTCRRLGLSVGIAFWIIRSWSFDICRKLGLSVGIAFWIVRSWSFDICAERNSSCTSDHRKRRMILTSSLFTLKLGKIWNLEIMIVRLKN